MPPLSYSLVTDLVDLLGPSAKAWRRDLLVGSATFSQIEEALQQANRLVILKASNAGMPMAW